MNKKIRHVPALDPFFSTCLLLAILVGIGLGSLALAWRGIAPRLVVAEQLPYLASGGLAGIGLVGFSLGVLIIQHRRWTEARRRAHFDRVVRQAEELLVAIQSEVK